MPPPNILLITADQMRRDHMGCGGNPVIRTPSLDRLADGGVCLDRCYVSNPLCMPNRCTLATGRLPRHHRVWNNGIDLPGNEPTIADELVARGYHTALLGKAHFRRFNSSDDGDQTGLECGAAWEAGLNDPNWTGPYYGFQHVQLAIGHGPATLLRAHHNAWARRRCPQALELWNKIDKSPIDAIDCGTVAYPPETHSSAWLGEIGSDYLRQRADDGRPFFWWVSFPDPHHPFIMPRPYDSMYDPAGVVMPKFGAEALADRPPYYRQAYQGGDWWEGIGPDCRLSQLTEAQRREIIARTYGMITMIDENVGRLLETLAATGLERDTIVVFTSDHGDLMGDCGLQFKGPFHLEGLINVPLIFRVPEGTGTGVAVQRCLSPVLGAKTPQKTPRTVTNFAKGREISDSPPGEISDSPHRHDLFSTVDLAPTLLGLLGIAPPRRMDGLDQSALARGGPGCRQAAYVEFKSMYHPELNLRTVITPTRKLTMYPGLPYGELYDMTAPVPEAVNLYDDPAHVHDRTRLKKRIWEEEIRTADELTWPEAHA